uniref:amino acid ABC transporter ATP-binding protein n=1 Tax=Brevundimonas nasdae TaxID=172043 RepID=UPI003F68E832
MTAPADAPPADVPVVIDIQGVSKWYGAFQVLNDCALSVRRGEVLVICGPSGSGKSTLLKTVNGLEAFQQGAVTVDGVRLDDPKVDLTRLRSRVGMVFQHFELFPHLTVMQNLTLAQVKVLGRSQAEAQARGLIYLERVGLIDHRDKRPAQLSGGQQQ